MKRIQFTVIAVLLLVLFCSCGNRSDFRAPVNFYYCTDPIDYNTSTAVVSPEGREGFGYTEDPKALLDLYLQGPVSDGFRSPFPKGVYVDSIDCADAIVHLSLNSSFSQLSGSDLTLACTCVSMTVFDMTDCEAVRICVTGGLLDGKEYIELSRDELLFLDEYSTQPGG